MPTATDASKTKSRNPGSAGHFAIERLRVKDLLLDHRNPRLPEFKKLPSQPELFTLILKRFSVSELLESFAANGYFGEEPLVAVPTRSPQGTHTVVEGNRRLAALLLLLDPNLARPFRIAVPHLSRQRRLELTKVPVSVRRTRAEVLPYLGFRHITGVMQWDSYSKARYVAQLVEQGHDLKAIQRDIGDRHQTAPRLYRAFLVWRVAEDNAFISVNGTTPNFSYLFTALTLLPVMKYLGLSNQGKPRPVRKSHLSQLAEITTYLYGSKRREPAIAESREIKDLAQALSNSRAHAFLKRGATVKEALEAMPAQEARLELLLTRLADALREATVLGPRHKKDRNITELAERCAEQFRKFRRAFSLNDS